MLLGTETNVYVRRNKEEKGCEGGSSEGVFITGLN